ncbi:EamA-like transporter family protein [Aureimonas jatrophae]|uniref:EamA-like transporter family protein n=1 Tax=Aureimonas jatrophae TaxID=1166073 RepID=A0A1H0EIK8_9HYPH|nr:EamA-like transporter family protein [Aureimonas jatrophae]
MACRRTRAGSPYRTDLRSIALRLPIRSNTKAILWVLTGTALFSILFASGKFAGESASVFQVMFLRYVGGFAALAVVAGLQRKGWASLRSRQPLLHGIRALFGVSGGLSIVYASAAMPIIDATAIGLLYVVFVVPLGVVVLREAVNAHHLWGILLSSLGAATVVASRGAFQAFDTAYLWPALVAVPGALLLAFEGLMIRMLAVREDPLVVLVHVNVFGLFLLLLPAWWTWQPTAALSLAPFLLLGPLVVTAQYCIVRGYALAPLAVVGPVDYAWLVFAALIGLAFFGEMPTAGVVVGSLVIAAGGAALAKADEHR